MLDIVTVRDHEERGMDLSFVGRTSLREAPPVFSLLSKHVPFGVVSRVASPHFSKMKARIIRRTLNVFRIWLYRERTWQL